MSPDAFGNINSKIQTDAIRVIITTDDDIIEGFLHIKPGGYQSRVSDLLNAKELRFVPITNATCQSLVLPDSPPRKLATVIIKVESIKMVVPVSNDDIQTKANPDTPTGVISSTPFDGNFQ